LRTSSSWRKRWRYPQGTCSSIYPNHFGVQLSVFGDTSGDTLFRNPVHRVAAACISQLAPTVTNERVSASECITVQAGAMWKKRTQSPRGQPRGSSTPPPGTKSQQLGSLLRSGGQFGPVSCAHFCAQRCLAILYSACATCGGSSAHGYVDPSSLHQLDALVSNVRGTPNRQQERAEVMGSLRMQ
jgi:hypothetical protein